MCGAAFDFVFSGHCLGEAEPAGSGTQSGTVSRLSRIATMTMPSRQALGDVFALVVHDLRNPTATISANLAFVREVLGSTPDEMSSVDVQEALDDAAIAL